MANNYDPASLKEVVRISLPLMISSLSTFLMVFCDRAILAHYSTSAMNSVATAGLTSFTFIFGTIGIAQICEVFAGQAYGAKRYHNVAKPMWQMIYFAMFSGLILLIIGQTCAELLLPDNLEADGTFYFKAVMAGSFLFNVQSAMAGYFAGTLRTKYITYAAIMGNIINVGLDVVLIFGIDGYLAPQGAAGAAYATLISQALQISYFCIYIFSRHDREKFNTCDNSFDLPVMKKCIKIGFPSALAHTFEMAAWSTIYHIAALTSAAHLTVLVISHNISFLFFFSTQGLEKGVTACGANLIGKNNIAKMGKLFRSASTIHLIMLIFIGIPMFFFPDQLLYLFNKQLTEGSVDITQYTYTALKLLWCFIALDGIAWIIAGILTSAGDTKFVMYINATCAWVFGVLPIYVITQNYESTPNILQIFSICYAGANMLSFAMRFSSNGWKLKAKIIE